MSHDINQHHGARKVYFVDVQAGRLYTEPDITPYHLAITANEKEYNEIMEIFYEMSDLSDLEVNNLVNLWTSRNQSDAINNEYDMWMNKVFEKLYQLGTEETRAHIKNMGILSL